MRTNDLITLLGHDARVRILYGRRFLLLLVTGISIAGLLLMCTAGTRPDLAAAIRTYRVEFKIGLTLLVAVLATRLAFQIGRPDAPLRNLATALLLPLVLLMAAALSEFNVVPQAEWFVKWVGKFPGFCMFIIPSLSFAPLVALLLALRRGAPENPTLSGAVAGLAAGGIGAAIYAWHCPDDSPLFLATWYSMAVGLVTLTGAIAGRHVLRW